MPYLITDDKKVQELEGVAHECDADYYEILLYNERADAIARLLKRGRWGEDTAPPITNDDFPAIDDLMTKMETALEKRPNTVKIDLDGNSPDVTYGHLLEYVES